MNIDICVLSKVGGRGNNEDYARHVQAGALTCMIVCDGLGGHENGEVASKFITDYLIERFKERPTMDTDLISNDINEANNGLIALQNGADGVKTTLTMTVTDGCDVVFAHVGDSRIYCMDDQKILYQSEDHSVPMMLYKMGEIKEKDIRGHEDGNRLLRVMGMEWERPKDEIHTMKISDVPEAGLMLCSDGFWEYILENQMIKLFKKAKSAEIWLTKMERAVLKKANKKTMDNYTAIVAKIRQ